MHVTPSRDLTGNQLSGPIPSSLLKRIQDGSLNLMSVILCSFVLADMLDKYRLSCLTEYICLSSVCSYADNPDLCTDGRDSCQPAAAPEGGKSKLAIYVAVTVALLVVVALAVLLCCLLLLRRRRRKKRGIDRSTDRASSRYYLLATDHPERDEID